jgi:cyclopropane-fatty-acyl-phospholipid synthase
MVNNLAKHKVEEWLAMAGIKLNGQNPWDVKVYDENFYTTLLKDGSIGAGESYMKKWWDCASLDELYARILNPQFEERLRRNWSTWLTAFLSKFINRQSQSRAFYISERHYDLGNELFREMLDKRMVYTCAYWKGATSLDKAQENKLDLTCRKLNINPGDHVLDIGCGWGSFAKFAAENYGARVTGITVSDEQVKMGNQNCKGLPVEIKLMDYRELEGKYDHVVSLGMFEHVGYKNYSAFMKVVSRCLKDDGLFLLHTIGSNTSSTWTDPWIEKYIFPGSLLPSIQQIGNAIEGIFVMEDWHNFSADYDKTLLAWHANFENHWPILKGKYDEKFHRMWDYYLLTCAGSFRARKNQLWQIVLSKNGVKGGYQSVR